MRYGPATQRTSRAVQNECSMKFTDTDASRSFHSHRTAQHLPNSSPPRTLCVDDVSRPSLGREPGGVRSEVALHKSEWGWIGGFVVRRRAAFAGREALRVRSNSALCKLNATWISRSYGHVGRRERLGVWLNAQTRVVGRRACSRFNTAGSTNDSWRRLITSTPGDSQPCTSCVQHTGSACMAK